MKSEVSSPRHLLLLAGLAPPIPTSSAPGAHPNLTGWAGTTGPGHCKAALAGPHIWEKHPSPTGVRVAAPQQGQPRLPIPLPCPQQGWELSSSHYIPTRSFPIHGHLLEQPARSCWASTLSKSCSFSSSNQVEDAPTPLLLTTSALGGPSSDKLVSLQGQAATTPCGEPGCRQPRAGCCRDDRDTSTLFGCTGPARLCPCKQPNPHCWAAWDCAGAGMQGRQGKS